LQVVEVVGLTAAAVLVLVDFLIKQVVQLAQRQL
tara:strand:+ start:48 stop:149 length:102 start_codon:yes stop_codon:yes gene_type:complete